MTFFMMHEESEAYRSQCHPDIIKSLDREFKHAQIDRAKLIDAENLCKGAQTGAWKIINGQIMKGQTPVNDTCSLAFLVKCWEIVPALLTSFYRLEKIVIDLIAGAMAARADKFRAEEALDAHRAEIARGQTTGPEHEFGILVECAKMGLFDKQTLENYFRRWFAGHSIGKEVETIYWEGVKRENDLVDKLTSYVNIESTPLDWNTQQIEMQKQVRKHFRAYRRKENDVKPPGACCENESRNMNGGCDNCKDPCL